MNKTNDPKNHPASRGKSQSSQDGRASHALLSQQELASSCLVGRKIQGVAFEDGLNTITLKMDDGSEVFIEPCITGRKRFLDNRWYPKSYSGLVIAKISSPNKEHAPLSAGASVDYGVDVETTLEHVNRAADRGCCVSPCSESLIIPVPPKLPDDPRLALLELGRFITERFSKQTDRQFWPDGADMDHVTHEVVPLSWVWEVGIMAGPEVERVADLHQSSPK